MSAYAALTVCGYRGVSGFYDPAIRLLFFLHRPGSALRTPDFSPARLFFFRESPVPSQLFHCVLCALCANLVFQDTYKNVSRRRKKKGRLRRDGCVDYRVVNSGLTSKAYEVSRYAFLVFIFF